MKNKDIVLIGGGASIEEGLKLDLWNKIKYKASIWSINFAFLTMPYLPEREIWVDISFFKNNMEAIQNIQKQGVKCYAKKHITYAAIPEITTYEATRYPKEIDKKTFIGRMGLSGFFALHLAVKECPDRIFLCFDKKTEVFTKRGWVLFKNLNQKDLLLTRKPNGKTEWSKINYKIQKKYNGVMFRLKQKGLDLLVTPEHKLCSLSKTNNKKYIWQKASNISNNEKYYFPKLFDWI